MSDVNTNEAYEPRLKTEYRERIRAAMREKFGYTNEMQIPKLDKIVLNMGIGEAVADSKKAQAAMKDLALIAGQKPAPTRSRKSIAQFKLRENMVIGAKVTLRRERMYEFVDRLITLAIPRVKDFRGLNPNGFDKDGNYNFGFTEQTVFPEVDAAAVTFQQGMNITMVTTARNIEEGRELLKQFGFPFRTDEKDKK